MPDIKVKGYSGTDLAYENVEKIWLTSKSGSGRETLLAEQELEFKADDTFGYIYVLPMDIGFSVGDMLTVVVDSEKYARTAVDAQGMAVIGNMQLLGGEDTGEPFIMVSNGTQLEGQIWSDTPTHTVAIYKGSTGAALVPFTYGELLTGVEVTPDFEKGDQQISVPDGSLVKEATILKPDTLIPENIKSGVEIAGVVGEYALETEEATVELDFSGGDMIVEPTEGKFLSRVDIPKPETLVPENIAKDVTIAGVVGTHEGSGGVESKFAIKSGSFKATVDGVQTITHGLGVPPEIMFLYTSNTPGTNGIIVLNGYCEKIKAEQVVELKTSSGAMFIAFSFGVDSKAGYSYGQFENVNPETFDVGGGTCKITNGITYYWTVIGGVVPDNDWIIMHLALDGQGNIIVTGGVPEIETLEVFLDGVSVGTVDYTYGDSTTIDISAYVTKATEYKVTVQANGTAIDGKYTNQYCYPVTGVVACPSGNCGEHATWMLNENEELVISGTGKMADYEEGKQPWYNYQSRIKKVRIEPGITSVGARSLLNATALTEVDIPYSVFQIGRSAFNGCTGLQNFAIPVNVATIDAMAFRGCSSLTSIEIPNSVTSIGNHAFYNCKKLATVAMGSGVLSVGESAFSECTSLSSVTLSNALEHIGPGAFRSTAVSAISVPKSVTKIDYNAFYLTSLTRAVFEDTSDWQVSTSSVAITGTTLSASSLADPSTAASFLKSTYRGYYWFKT